MMRAGFETGGVLADFCEPHLLTSDYIEPVADEPGVHVVWNPEGELLYVGMSKRQRGRLKQHLCVANW